MTAMELGPSIGMGNLSADSCHGQVQNYRLGRRQVMGRKVPVHEVVQKVVNVVWAAVLVVQVVGVPPSIGQCGV